MAKGIPTLIRVKEWLVDEHRRNLSAKLEELSALEEALKKLKIELLQEQHACSTNPEIAGVFYGHYARAVIERREELHSFIMAKEEEVKTSQEELAEAYRELKKYEVVHESQRRKASNDLLRVDQSTMDELGLQARYFRQT